MTDTQHQPPDQRLYDDALDTFTSEGGCVPPAMPSDAPLPRPMLKNRHVVEPTAAERELMASLDIDFEAGGFRFESYRYARLPDAVLYAKLARRRRDANGDRRP
jgi:hypothetical protein